MLTQSNQLSVRLQELRQLYGRKSEAINPSQLTMALLDQSDGCSESQEEESPAEEDKPSSRRRRKAKRGRKPLPAYLPRKEIRITPTDEQVAAASGGMKPFSEKRSEVLEYEPARFKLLVYIQEVCGPSALPTARRGLSMASQALPAALRGEQRRNSRGPGNARFAVSYLDSAAAHEIQLPCSAMYED